MPRLIISTIAVLQFIFLMQISGFSQKAIYVPGYLVNNSNDTVYGEGAIGSNHRFVWFRQDGMQDVHKYFPNDVTCARFNSGKYYVSRSITYNEADYKLFKKEITQKTENFFLEYLLDGEVDIFMFRFQGFAKYYIEKNGMPLQELPFYEYIVRVDGKYYQIKNQVFKEFLKTYMEDSPQTCDEINKMQDIGQRSLIKISENYHHRVCSDYNCVNYTKKLFGRKKKRKT